MSDPLPLHKVNVQADDGHRWQLLTILPKHPQSQLLWLPAMGVAAKHYLPFAEALAARGVAVFLHEWRGNGSSSLRSSHTTDWGYREVLTHDLSASEAVMATQFEGLPRIIGGHSLGGQLACCRLGLSPRPSAEKHRQRLWLVASGAPYWRACPLPARVVFPLAFRFLPWLADRRGYLPGRRLRFAGNEARGVIHDWARSGLSGCYAAQGLDRDLEAAMGDVDCETRAIALAHDWLAPESSMRFLLSKLPRSSGIFEVLGNDTLGTHADHFAWMKAPTAVAEALLRPSLPG
ncbi:MAG TPA: alpha/beta fold hydrolase [Lysobacter sp.]